VLPASNLYNTHTYNAIHDVYTILTALYFHYHLSFLDWLIILFSLLLIKQIKQ
jgi:hypothetical protein